MPKVITHTLRLENAEAEAGAFIEQLKPLGEKLSILLVQLPPSLAFASRVADGFFAKLSGLTDKSIVCEPRHASWSTEEANAILRVNKVSRAAADPARVPVGSEPGGWRGLSYYRLHGSPKVYYSSYAEDYLAILARRLSADAQQDRAIWCIFDNTTLGFATRNALDLQKLLTLDQ